MDAADVKVEILRLLNEDPDVRAAVYRAVTVDVVPASSGIAAKAMQAVKAKVMPPWLQR